MTGRGGDSFKILDMLPLVASLNLEFYAAEPTAQLFFNHVGFLSVGSAEGPVGPYLNPAVLTRTRGTFSAYLGYSSSAQTPPDSFNFKVPLRMDSLSYDLNLSSKVTFSDLGGPSYLGVAFHLGPVAFGGSLFRPSLFGASVDGDVPVEYESDSLATFGYVVSDPDNDSVAVNLTPYGTVKGKIFPKGDIRMRETPLFAGAAVGGKVLALGVGLNVRRIEGRLNFGTRLSVDSGTTLKAKVRPADPGWDASNLNVSLVYDPDPSLVGTRASGSFAATYIAPVVGLNLNLLVVGVNLAAEMGLSGSTGANFSTSLLLPKDAEMEVLSDSVDIDSTTRRISGSLLLRVRRTGDTTVSRDFSATYRLARYVGVRGGVRLLFLSISGAAEFPVEVGKGLFYYGRNYFTPNLLIPLGPIEARVGGVFMWRYAFFGNTVLPSAPMFYGGGGLSLKAPLGTEAFGIERLDVGVRGSFLSYLVKVVAEGLSGGKLGDFSTAPTVAFSLGAQFYVR